jgi:hypothetical protein
MRLVALFAAIVEQFFLNSWDWPRGTDMHGDLVNSLVDMSAAATYDRSSADSGVLGEEKAKLVMVLDRRLDPTSFWKGNPHISQFGVGSFKEGQCILHCQFPVM